MARNQEHVALTTAGHPTPSKLKGLSRLLHFTQIKCYNSQPHNRQICLCDRREQLTHIAAGLAVLRVTGVGAVHTGAQGGQRCSRLLGLFLFGLRALIITVTLAQVVKAKVLDLVAALARCASLCTLLALLVLFVLKAKELQLCFSLCLLGLCRGGSESKRGTEKLFIDLFFRFYNCLFINTKLEQGKH